MIRNKVINKNYLKQLVNFKNNNLLFNNYKFKIWILINKILLNNNKKHQVTY
jgi:hypothetical protein